MKLSPKSYKVKDEAFVSIFKANLVYWSFVPCQSGEKERYTKYVQHSWLLPKSQTWISFVWVGLVTVIAENFDDEIK